MELMEKKVKVVNDPEKYDSAIVNHPFYKEMIKKVITTIKKHNSSPSILEIGMGTGTLTEHLLKLNFTEFEGIEPEKEDYEFVKLKFKDFDKKKIAFKNIDLWNLKTDKKFDIITSSFVDHHIPPEKKLDYYKLILSLLKKDGLYIAGEEPISDYSNNDERIIKLFKYHGYIIKTCIENAHFDMAEIETRALKNGIEQWDEFKISVPKYKKILLDAKMNIIEFKKLGPDELSEAGVYVIVGSH